MPRVKKHSPATGPLSVQRWEEQRRATRDRLSAFLDRIPGAMDDETFGEWPFLDDFLRIGDLRILLHEISDAQAAEQKGEGPK
jgi:hypothetical protein